MSTGRASPTIDLDLTPSVLAADVVGFVYNGQRPEYLDFARRLAVSLEAPKSAWFCAAEDLESLAAQLDDTGVIVTIGGDGTILRTVRHAAQRAIPLLGINKGRVGFMTELTEEEAGERLSEYLSGDNWVEERSMLQATINRRESEAPPEIHHALNDHVLGRASVARLVDVELKVNGVLLTTFRTDAVIASTSTGSTAYAMSAGGPIVHPHAHVFVVQPVAPHIGMRTGLVLSHDDVIELSLTGSHSGILSVDGFTDAKLGPHDTVEVRRSSYTARFLRQGSAAKLYARLTERLGLAGRPEVPLTPPD